MGEGAEGGLRHRQEEEVALTCDVAACLGSVMQCGVCWVLRLALFVTGIVCDWLLRPCHCRAAVCL